MYRVMKKMSVFETSKSVLAILLSLMISNPAANSAKTPMPKKQLSADVIADLSQELLSAADPTPGINKIPEDWLPPFDRTNALKDPQDRISKEFQIPKSLMPRVGFWFDIYTKYGSNQHVIHHTKYPWVVFDVIDTSEIDEDTSLHKWTRYHKAKKHVRSQYAKIKSRLKSLSRRKSYRGLNAFDKKLYAALINVRGSRRTVFREAYLSMRSQLGQKDFFLNGLHYSPRYLPYMEQIFLAKGLPVELTRIPFVESSFNPHAESKVGASGIWQIMPRTGKSYFTVSENFDERNSPLKASLAAAELLKHNYKVLKDWPLSVVAYNHGATGIKNALKKSKSTNIIQLISRYHQGSFKFASANFFPSFLAALFAEKYSKEIFRNNLKEQEQLLRYSIYTLAKPMKASKLVKMLGVESKTFVDYNLDLKSAVKSNAVIPKNYRFLVPFERQLDLESKLHLGIKPVKAANATVLKNHSS